MQALNTYQDFKKINTRLGLQVAEKWNKLIQQYFRSANKICRPAFIGL